MYDTHRWIAVLYRHKLYKYEESRQYYNNALQVATLINDNIKIADILKEIGCVNLQYNKVDSVLYFYNKSLAVAQKAQDTLSLNSVNIHLSGYYEHIGDYEKSLQFILKVGDNVIHDVNANWIPEPLLKTAELEQRLGYFEQSATHYERYIYLKDSITKIKRAKDFSLLELKFDLEKKEKENELKDEILTNELSKQKLARNFFMVFSVLLFISIYLLYRNYKTKQMANKQLHEAFKQKLKFFTNISHELRTPLTLLVSPLERIKGIIKDPEAESIVNSMVRNTNKLKDQINQLLDISKIDNKILSIDKGLHDFILLFKSVSTMFNSMAEDKSITYIINIEPEQLFFSYDQERIKHVITNLLSNAFKFTHEGGKIITSVSKVDNNMIFSVRDTGIGIPADDINNIFKRFYQSGNGKNEPYDGTGLGLNIVKEYIEIHEGSITVSSELGKGSEFIVKLSLKQYCIESNENIEKDMLIESHKAIPNKNEIIQVKDNKETMLIVEDSKDLRNYLKIIFQSQYKLFEASNGEDGKQVAIKENPDIIISDVMMPVCDGYCLTEYLKSHIETSHIPIILLTAKATRDDKLTGYNYGADDYIAKPFDEKELELKVSNILKTLKSQKLKYKNTFQFGVSEIVISSIDERFLQNATKIIENNISNINFNIDQLCGEANISRRTMFRKIKALTDMNPSQFIRTIRLKVAEQLLSQNAGSISEIAYQTGFEDPSYFSKCFKEVYKKSPSSYLNVIDNQ